MKRLNQENIQFIDTYLKNSEIVFADIRVEMIDHVASEIEERINHGDSRDFYYIFKDYMVENKATLLKDNRAYYKISDKKILKNVAKIAFSIKGILVFFLILFSFNLMSEFIDDKQLIMIIKYAPFIIMLLVAGVYYFLVRKKNERYSSTERIGFYFMLIMQLINMSFNARINSETVTIESLLRLKIGASLIIFIIALLMLTAFQFKKEYQLKFKSIE